MNKKRWVLLLLLLILLLTTTATWAWFRTDPHLAKIQDLRTQMQAEDLTRERRTELRGQMREEIEQLSPEVRESLFAERQKERQKRQVEQMREFFALPKDKQIAELDKQIDRQRRGRGGPNGGPPGGRFQQNGGQNGQAGNNGQGQGGQRGGGFGGNRGLSSMDRRRNYLDNTTPQFRAQSGEYQRMMQQRRTQRGV